MSDTVPVFYAEGDAKVWMEGMIDTSAYVNYRFAFRDDSKAVLDYGYILAFPPFDEHVQHDFNVMVDLR